MAGLDHIVVLMMENRSFDHMLGYLKYDEVLPDVDGLTAEMGNPDADGEFHRVAPIGDRNIHLKALDPGHLADDVEKQLADRNSGFLTNFVQCFERHSEEHPPPDDYVFDPTLAIAFQQAKDVLAFDYLARRFTVCDHWFSSVAGPTWPNRMFAMSGGTGPKAPPKILGWVPDFAKKAPLYDKPAFVRWLEPEQWRWYSHDPATVRLADSAYRPGGEKNLGGDENFAYFNRRTLLEPKTFLDDAANGRLREVSWIDPNFVDFRMLGPPGSNDDHPPSRIMLGQELVLTVVSALVNSGVWDKTMLVITYDEHGGFYDHVVPTDFDVPGDEGAKFGVRVPALVVSPLVGAEVDHTVYDHTSILKTILTRFSERADEALEAMGVRTQAANSLLDLVSADQPPNTPPADELEQLTWLVSERKSAAYQGQLLEPPTAGEEVSDFITSLQADIVGAALVLRDNGLSPGKP